MPEDAAGRAPHPASAIVTVSADAAIATMAARCCLRCGPTERVSLIRDPICEPTGLRLIVQLRSECPQGNPSPGGEGSPAGEQTSTKRVILGVKRLVGDGFACS